MTKKTPTKTAITIPKKRKYKVSTKHCAKVRKDIGRPDSENRIRVLKKNQCCECRKIYGEKIITATDQLILKFAARDGYVVSHGLCKKCAKPYLPKKRSIMKPMLYTASLLLILILSTTALAMNPKVVFNSSAIGCVDIDDTRYLASLSGDRTAFLKAARVGEATGKCKFFHAGQEGEVMQTRIFRGMFKVRQHGEPLSYWVDTNAVDTVHEKRNTGKEIKVVQQNTPACTINSLMLRIDSLANDYDKYIEIITHAVEDGSCIVVRERETLEITDHNTKMDLYRIQKNNRQYWIPTKHLK